MTRRYSSATSFSIFLIMVGVLIGLSSPLISQNAMNKCAVVSDGIDLKTKKYTKMLVPERIFHHTPPEIRNEIGGKGLIQCSGQLAEIDDLVYLNLNIEIFSGLAPQRYGGIKRDHLLRITLIDGKQVDLRCHVGSDGENYVERNSYIYPVSFILDRPTRRSLARLEIDKVGLQWTSGYEEYVVYDLDFFINQLSCLNQNTKRPN